MRPAGTPGRFPELQLPEEQLDTANKIRATVKSKPTTAPPIMAAPYHQPDLFESCNRRQVIARIGMKFASDHKFPMPLRARFPVERLVGELKPTCVDNARPRADSGMLTNICKR